MILTNETDDSIVLEPGDKVKLGGQQFSSVEQVTDEYIILRNYGDADDDSQ